MDREILFRGKRADNGEWVEGYYVPLGDKFHYILTGRLTITNNFPQFEHFCVIPETVGQYTGLRDKNGRKIFEGDIVQIENPKPFKPYVSDIKYVGTSFVWGVYVLGEFNEIEKIEVIGNIHDNPELIGGDPNA